MKTKTSSASRRFLAKSLLAAALTISSVSHIDDAKASGWPVVDIAAIMNALQNYYDQYGRWIETTQHYAATIDQYAKTVAFWDTQFNKLQQLNFSLFKLQHTFTEVDPDFGADVECPGRVASSGVAGVLDKALSVLVPDMKGDVVQQQQNICVLIVEAKNQKYNDTVKYLNSIQAKGQELAATQSLTLLTGGKMGNMTNFIGQISQFGETLNQSKSEWETNMKQIDMQIDMLLTMQANLSRRALKGSPSVIGTIVNAGALKAAFD
jgi:hypothetical protein